MNTSNQNYTDGQESFSHVPKTFDYLKREVGERLRLERVRNHLTQEELGFKIGVSASYISALERGERPLSRAICKKYHDQFQLSYDYLFEGLCFSPEMMSTMLREAEDPAHTYFHRFEILIGTCSDAELVTCYRMCSTYLAETRKAKKAETYLS